MKTIIALLGAFVLVFSLEASETTLNIYRTNKMVQRIQLGNILNITTANQDSTLIVTTITNQQLSVAINEIDSITYSNENYNLPTVNTVSIDARVDAGATSGIVEVTDDGGCAILDRGMVWATHSNPTVNDNKFSGGETTGAFYAFLNNLEGERNYYVRGFATNCWGTAYGENLLLEQKRGNVTYNLAVDPGAAFYDQLKQALDSACYYYNRYTSFEANIYVYYNEGIPTAQASYRGSIGFGPNTSYMWVGTVMHEMAHYFGSGTTQAWRNLMVNGVWQGPVAQALCQEITGETLRGDNNANPIHYWPTGINYRSEVSSVQDLIDHARIIQAMLIEDAKIPNK